MLENLDQLIDSNLKIIAESQKKQVFLGAFKGVDSFREEQLRFAEILEDKGLVEIESSKRQRCDLTERGYEIHKIGGWLAYLKIENEKQEAENKLEELKREKETLLTMLELQKSATEQKLNKRHLKTFWVIFTVVVLSALYNIYDFIAKISKDEKPNEEMVTKEELQKELSNLRKTLILEFQNKDSLINSKNQTDSIR